MKTDPYVTLYFDFPSYPRNAIAYLQLGWIKNLVAVHAHFARKKKHIIAEKNALFCHKKALFNMNSQCKFTDIPMIILKYS